MDALSHLDPRTVPVISLTQEERESIQARMAVGELPTNYFDMITEATARNVFGHDHKKDRHGRPIEQGHGARGHETANHFAALKKAEAMGVELSGTYDKAVAEIWKRDATRAQKLGLPGGK
jgi:hypothetical protein